ncbi:MAG TPA: hypothetical protein VIM19_00565 [Actinomycetes bacterium]
MAGPAAPPPSRSPSARDLAAATPEGADRFVDLLAVLALLA